MALQTVYGAAGGTRMEKVLFDKEVIELPEILLQDVSLLNCLYSHGQSA